MENVKSTRELHLGRMKMWDASMANHGRYIDAATGLFKEEYVVNRPCPVCGRDNPSPLFNKAGGTYCRCGRCHMLFLNPILRSEQLESYYRNNNDIQSEVVRNDSGFYSALYNKGLDSVLSSMGRADGSGLSLVDVGCSAGSFLDIARKCRFATVGLELNSREAAYCREKGHKVFEIVLEKLPDDERYDVITLWDVFEHIVDGRGFLELAARHLKEDGVIFIQSPTQDSLAARILREKCNLFDGLEHVNIYSRVNMEDIARQTGLRIMSSRSVIAEAGVIANYLAYADPYLGNEDSSGLTPFVLKADEILANDLGYKFQIVMKRG